jgi:hypothetical protein
MLGMAQAPALAAPAAAVAVNVHCSITVKEPTPIDHPVILESNATVTCDVPVRGIKLIVSLFRNAKQVATQTTITNPAPNARATSNTATVVRSCFKGTYFARATGIVVLAPGQHFNGSRQKTVNSPKIAQVC